MAVSETAGRARRLGFTALLFPADLANASTNDLAEFAERVSSASLEPYVDLSLGALPADHPLVAAHPDVFRARVETASDTPIDPRRLRPRAAARAFPRLRDAASRRALGELLDAWLRDCVRAGVSGFRVRPEDAPAEFWTERIVRARAEARDCVFIAQTPGLAREDAAALQGCGFDWTVSSLAWWDGRSAWLAEEHAALAPIAPLLSEVKDGAPAHQLAVAAATSAGVLVDEDILERVPNHQLADALKDVRELARFNGALRMLTSPTAPVTALLRASEADLRWASEALLVLINTQPMPAVPEPDAILSALGAPFGPFKRPGGGLAFASMEAGEARLLTARRSRPVRTGRKAGARQAAAAARKPRLVIENPAPAVDQGALPVKRVVGDLVEVTADAFGDGHEFLAVELAWRPCDEKDWRVVPMTPLGNDRWAAQFPLERLGRHEYAVGAWLDEFGGYQRNFAKKIAAGTAETVDLAEGREMVVRARERSEGATAEALAELVAALQSASEEDQVLALLSANAAALMAAADVRPFAVRRGPVTVDAERLQARFASWYELFPRSITKSADRHGTFRDVIGRLPAVRDMGFDVLYFPPIHPIGRTNRKGKNNARAAESDDVGSPYATGSEEGGHDAIHPELGTIDDFRALVDAAAEHGLEIALDFAIQCSPDHPWIKEHPGWFAWRPDGSMKYAENPPKKYEDIVNVDFYAEEAVPGLWLALRDVVLHWVREGVKTFRVDNPHTKPLPFWEWLIRDVRSAHPEVIFLSEAFTRPKLMYRLAKIGFSQSYTYFTWRHTKAELTDYLTELTRTAPKDFFRPNFFVNTPDINPPFLQTSGRAGFLIRAALASTLSGLWGVYSGFEILESEPLPGREEYKGSEKYEIRPRDWDTPGNIIADIARLNRIRKNHPALQSHLGLRFYNAFNDHVLYYGKATRSREDMVLVAVNLDPHAPQEADFEIPLWEWGLTDDGAVAVEDLLSGARFVWRGKIQRLRLEPAQPFAIWRVEPL